ncbi:MAG: fibronectin type III domain-containing protein [Candidatus Aminicenantaceae bacterium]
MKKSFIFSCIFVCLMWMFLGGLGFLGTSDAKESSTDSAQIKGWSNPVKISDTKKQYYCRDPNVAVDELKNVHAIWVQKTGGDTEEIYYNLTEEGEWQEPLRSIMSRRQSWSGPWPAIKVDRYRNVNVVYLNKGEKDYEIFLRRRRLADEKWENEQNVSNSGIGTAHPDLVIDPITNDYYIFFMNVAGGGYRILTRYMIEGEGDWADGGMLPHSNNKAYVPRADIDYEGKIYLVYINRYLNKNVYFTWTDEATNENSWTQPELISHNHKEVDFPHPEISVDKDGNAYVVWMDARSGNREVYFRKRINGDWQDPKNLSQSSGDSKYPLIAVDRATGDAYVAWEEGNKILLREYKQSEDKWGSKEIATENHPEEAEGDLGLCASVYGDVHLIYTEDRSGNRDIYHRFKKGREPDEPVAPLVDTNLQTRLEVNNTKTNIFSWRRNPENGALHLTKYIVYRKRQGQGDNQYEKQAEPPLSQTLYKDTGLSTGVKYVYAISARDKFNNESNRSKPAMEDPVFIPQDLDIETKLNRALFSTEKINTLTWTDNRLNDPVQNRQYKIYRKRSTEEDSAFVLIFTADRNASSYTERMLPLTEKFVYRLSVIDNNGNESLWLEVDED